MKPKDLPALILALAHRYRCLLVDVRSVGVALRARLKKLEEGR